MEDTGLFIKSLYRKQATLNVLALLVSAVGPLVCMIIAGSRFGSDGLAIIALCSPLFFAASFFGFTISGGGQVLCSEFIAKDALDDVNKVYSASIALTAAINIVVCALLLIFQNPILTFLATDVSAELVSYYNFFVLYAFFSMLVYIPLFFSRAAGQERVGLILTSIVSGIGIGASLTLIQFMGIEAVALGQAIGTGAGFVVAMFLLRKHFRITFPKNLFIKKIFTLGSPMGLTRLYLLIATLVLNMLFLRVGGSEALAVFGVVSILHRFVTSINVGISQTLVPLVAVFHTEQDITSIKQTLKLTFLYGNVVIVAAGVLLIVLNSPLAMLFGLHAGSLGSIMPLYALYNLFLINVMILSSYYNATKQLKLANVLPFMQELTMLCVGALVFAAVFGLFGIWVAFPLSGIATLSILLIILFIKKLRNKELIFMLLQSSRLEKDGRYISFSVDAVPSKISEAAEKISDFCEANDLTPKQVMLISMSVEEIITLIVNNTSKSLSVSVRLFLFDDTIVLRIRNTGEKFDSVEYYKANIADDIEKSLEIIGMKYIVQSARNIYYRQTFGVNSLVVII